MTSIRRILDILGALSHAQQTRVMAFVNARVADTSELGQARDMRDVKLGGLTSEIAKPSRAAQLPFPDADTTKKVMDGMAKAGDMLGHALIGTAKVDVNQ